MKPDTIVYEKKGGTVRLAVLQNGQMVEFDMFDTTAAIEGNVYLGRIVHKLETAGGHTAFKVNIGDTAEAFLNAYEPELKEVNMSEGQSVVVQIAQEKRVDKGAKVVRNIQIVGTTVVYRPFRTDIEISSKSGSSFNRISMSAPLPFFSRKTLLPSRSTGTPKPVRKAFSLSAAPSHPMRSTSSSEAGVSSARAE